MTDPISLASENERLRERIRDLEYALAGAVWLEREDWHAFHRALRLSPSEAHVLGMLYVTQAKGLPRPRNQELADAIPDEIIYNGGKLKIEHYRGSNLISVHLWRIRKRYPDILANAGNGRRTFITDAGMIRLGLILSEASRVAA